MNFGHLRGPTGISGAIASWLLLAGVVAADEPVVGGLRLAPWREGGIPTGHPISREAIQVFVHEGAPHSVRVTAQHIAVDYGRSGVFFDRGTGAVARRFTAAEGWPNVRPDGFAKPARRAVDAHLVGPGVLNPWFTPPVTSTGFPGAAIGPDLDQAPLPSTVVEVKFDSAVWRAIHPRSPENEPSTSQRGLLGRNDDQVQFQELPNKPAEPFDPYQVMGGDSLVASYPSAGTNWVQIPLGDRGQWIVGEFGSSDRPHGDQHGVLESSTAVWVFSEGEIIRLDRRRLIELAQSLRDKR